MTILLRIPCVVFSLSIASLLVSSCSPEKNYPTISIEEEKGNLIDQLRVEGIIFNPSEEVKIAEILEELESTYPKLVNTVMRNIFFAYEYQENIITFERVIFIVEEAIRYEGVARHDNLTLRDAKSFSALPSLIEGKKIRQELRPIAGSSTPKLPPLNIPHEKINGSIPHSFQVVVNPHRRCLVCKKRIN